MSPMCRHVYYGHCVDVCGVVCRCVWCSMSQDVLSSAHVCGVGRQSVRCRVWMFPSVGSASTCVLPPATSAHACT